MQSRFPDVEYAVETFMTRRDRFLSEIEAVTPWSARVAAIEPPYPKADHRGRAPFGLEDILQIDVAPQCSCLLNEGVANASYDLKVARNLIEIELTRETAPDATALLTRLLEAPELTERIFTAINQLSANKGRQFRKGRIVDASISESSSSAMNRDETPELELHQTNEGDRIHVCMNTPVDIDANSGLTHSGGTTAANLRDVTKAHSQLHSDKSVEFSGAGSKRFARRKTQCNLRERRIAMSASMQKAPLSKEEARVRELLPKHEANVHTLAGSPFLVVASHSSHTKPINHDLDKSAVKVPTLFGLTNLCLGDWERRILP